jgi:hypothetical protein
MMRKLYLPVFLALSLVLAQSPTASASPNPTDGTFNIQIFSQVINDLSAQVDESNQILNLKRELENSNERNIQIAVEKLRTAKKFPEFADSPGFNDSESLITEWRVNLQKAKVSTSTKSTSSLSWTEIFKQASAKSFQEFSSRPPILSSDRLKITNIEFPTKPTNQQIPFFRVFVSSKYFVSNLLVGANFGGNYTGGGVGFASGSIYPGAPIIINSDGIVLSNLIESISFTNNEYQYQILVPLYITKEANLTQYFSMADSASFIIRDASRSLIACPWWFARNGSPIATNPEDQWVKSQLFASPSNNPECANSTNSKYVLMQDSFESNLLPHTSNGGYELLRSLYADYSKIEQAFNSAPGNLDLLTAQVRMLKQDNLGQVNMIEGLDIFLKKASLTKAAANKKTTITCVKGKLVKKVTGFKPKCPAGYKKK